MAASAEQLMAEIDRISPTMRPKRTPNGYQRWRDLLFLHWRVDSDVLQRLLPARLQVDCHEGHAYIGVVPFSMEDVRPWRWVPSKLAFQFLECNVRTYVVCDGRPGVYFFSLDAASRLAVWAARTFWGLPYFNARMAVERGSRSGRGIHINYQMHRWRTNEKHSVRYRVGRELGPSSPGTIEHFLLERYLLFVAHKGKLQVGQVHHAPYPACEVNDLHCHDELAAAAGISGLGNEPDLAHYSHGVDVEIFPLSPA